MDIDNAYKAELSEIRDDISANPESGEEFGAMAFGAFRLWLRAAGYLGDDENDTIAYMRGLSERVMRYGYETQKAAGF